MFGWRITRVEGHSMEPGLCHGDYVVSRMATASPGDVVLIDHPSLGRIVKRVLSRDENGALIVFGDSPLSTSSEVIGPIRPDDIEGVVCWRIAPVGLSAMPRMSLQR
ncbi:MAG: S24/S26 family peptidase [Candidatus Phaeomarinobacter sp.]